MMLSIDKMRAWWKKSEIDVVLGFGVFLLVMVSFLAGRISSGVKGEAKPVIIEMPAAVSQEQQRLLQGNLIELALPEGSGGGKAREDRGGIPESEWRGKFVASKNGKYYYWPMSGFAGRIKPENRVWLNSQEEAESRGYERSSDFDRFRNR